MNRYHFLFFICWSMISACTNYSPKPFGYFRIDIPNSIYNLTNTLSNIEFEVSSQATIIDILPQDGKKEFFNIVYPSLNVQIYCSYIPIKKHNLVELCEESRRFAYLHTIKADAIVEQTFSNPQKKVYGICYDIKGNVASPCQFVLTDSVGSFFRGALYFDNVPNRDSIAPVLEHIRDDIQILIESFRWKHDRKS